MLTSDSQNAGDVISFPSIIYIMATDSDMDCSTFSIGLNHKDDRNDGVARRLDFDCTQPFGDDTQEEGQCAKAPADDADARIFRAKTFLKRAQQEASATQAHVYGAEQAAIELSKLLAKRQSAVTAAERRLKSLESSRKPASFAAAAASSAAAAAPSASVKHVSKPKEGSKKSKHLKVEGSKKRA